MSLSARLAIFSSLLVIATSVIIGVALTQTATDDLYDDLEARGMAIARGLANRAAPLVEQNSRQALQQLLESFWEERDVARIEVEDPEVPMYSAAELKAMNVKRQPDSLMGPGRNAALAAGNTRLVNGLNFVNIFKV